MTNLAFRFALGAVVARLLLAVVFLLVQFLSPGEGGMTVILDIPTHAVLFVIAFLFGWPEGVTDAYDATFLGFGLITWLLLGLVIGIPFQRVAGRTGTPRTDHTGRVVADGSIGRQRSATDQLH